MTLRWGFLGASRIGRRALAPAIAAAPGHSLCAVAARDPARAREYAAALAIPVAHESYGALVEAADIDVIYNALPNDRHAPWTRRALAAGKHVLCEKPLTLSEAEAESIAEAEARSGRRAMEAFCQFHHPQFARARAIVAGGIGAPVAAHAWFAITLGSPDDYRWHAAQGGGALFDLGCYCVSTLRLLLGREPVAVAATQAMRGDVDASFTGMLDFGDGLAAQFSCSFVAAYAQHLEIIGTTNALRMDWPFSTKDRATHLTVGEACETFAPTDPYRAMVQDFGAAITAGAALPHPIAASVAQARTLDALRRAAVTGAVVRLT